MSSSIVLVLCLKEVKVSSENYPFLSFWNNHSFQASNQQRIVKEIQPRVVCGVGTSAQMDPAHNDENPPTSDVKLIAYHPSAPFNNGEAPLANVEEGDELGPPTPPPPLPPPANFATSLAPPPRPQPKAPSEAGHSEPPSDRPSLNKKRGGGRNLVKDSSRPKPVRGTMHVLSGLYARMVVAVTAVLITTEVLPNTIPLFFFHGYLFTYLLGAGVVCVICIYMSLIVQKCPGADDVDDGSCDGDSILRRPGTVGTEVSAFFRIGALVFGLGTLVAIGLEIATLFSLEKPCIEDKLNFVQPVIYALFTFMQMHFLSLNSQKAVQCLGWCRPLVLMHLCATNLAVWLRLLIVEGTRTLLDASHVQINVTEQFPPAGFNVTMHSVDSDGRHSAYVSPNCVWLEQDQAMEGVLSLRQCYQNTTIGQIWDKAQPFITPFIIQFCLMGAAVTYVLWDGHGDKKRRRSAKANSWSPRHHDVEVVHKGGSKVDCKGSSKGLFLGLLVLAVGIVVLILFFVLTNNPNLREETLFLMVVVHASLLGVSLLGSLLASCRTGSMCTDPGPKTGERLHNLLQTVGVIAVYLHGACSIVVGSMNWRNTRHLAILVDGGAMLLQSVAQSQLFHKILQKNCSGSRCSHGSARPGRQVVTFLAFVNLVLWVTESFTDHNHVSSQLQLQFFGHVPWQLMSRAVLPLVMFYRFESAVFLMETWKFGYGAYV
ncbi:hypothetical protein JTE90_009033 [Oedothorax gibbosus]|uniref:Uncharacterized protein n=1 Tax=Oedothorax gibbosus TaxID=931172 RepID=A0AAV6VKI1_9ARAC|nr:hypothetical protein JTE90_009033 [Oedothorax gibbosus]